MVITGKAEKPVYLYVHDGNVEIRPAAHIWGLDTFDTYDILLNETDPKARAAVIGPAGERLVRFAAILQGGRKHSRAAGRGGMGAVFGSKLIKGIVVLGSEKVQSTNPNELRTLVRQQIPMIKESTIGLSKYGTAGGVAGAELFGDLPLHNYTGGSWPKGAMAISGQSLAERYTVKQTFCFACPIGCGKHVDAKLDDGTHIQGEGPEYETLAGMGALTAVGNLDTMLKANDYCNRVGMDTISASTLVAFAIEAFENGLITAKDCDDHELNWEDPDSLLLCLRLMAERKALVKFLHSVLGKLQGIMVADLKYMPCIARDWKWHTMTPGQHSQWQQIMRPVTAVAVTWKVHHIGRYMGWMLPAGHPKKQTVFQMLMQLKRQ